VTLSRPLSRRSLLCATAKAVPALAVGGSLFGHSLDALAGPSYKAVDDGKIVGPEGDATLVTDFVMAPELRILAEATLQKARAAFATAAANPSKKLDKNKLTKVSQKFIAAQKSARIVRAQGRASALLGNVTKARAELGGYAEATVSQWQADSGFEAVRKRVLEKSDWAAVEKKIKRKKKKVVQEKKVVKEKKVVREKHEEEDFESKPKYSKLELHLNTVRCREETDEVGSDEILLGGQLIRPDGVIKSIDSFKVSDDFDAGETRYYDSSKCIDMPKEFRAINENAGVCHGHYSDPYRGKLLVRTNLDGPWPGTYGLLLVMVEEDYGGINSLLKEIHDAVHDELQAAIVDASSKAGGPINAEELGAIIGEVIGWIVSGLMAWLVNLFDNQDDPISTQAWLITVANPTKEWFNERTAGGLSAPSGERASKMKKLDFNGDGGKYRARLHFRALA
jgi:hypothetical protein